MQSPYLNRVLVVLVAWLVTIFAIIAASFGELKDIVFRMCKTYDDDEERLPFFNTEFVDFVGYILDLRVISFLRSLKLPPTSPIYVYISAEDVVT
jgi:hypothetical protein